MLGHGLATEAMRAQRGDSRIGVTLNLYAVSPATGSAPDADAARRIDGLMNRWFLDPILLGSYPADVIDDLREVTDLQFVQPGDTKTIAAPLDRLGINYYSRHVVAAGDTPSYPSSWPGSEDVRFVSRGLPATAMDWEIDAPGLYEVLTRVANDYPSVPLYITENGAAFDDIVGPDGAVDDSDRVAYFHAHLSACHSAIQAGVPLRGYFAWSLMDNFEWGWGFGKRFGIVYVDYPTQQRFPKRSANWYAEVISRNGLPDDL
jgi:beta-glucosidase